MSYDNDADLLLNRAGELAGVSFFAVMLLLGVTNRVVICRHAEDLYWTMAPPVVLVASLLLGMFFARDMHDPIGIMRGFLYAGIVGAVAAAYRPLRWSVQDNGFVLGWIVFAFKIIACPVIAIVAAGALSEAPPRDAWVDYQGRYHPAKGWWLGHLAFGLACTALLHRLVNGEQTQMRRWERQMLAPGSPKQQPKPQPKADPSFRIPRIELARPNRSAGSHWQ